jgi:hypothetical protein
VFQPTPNKFLKIMGVPARHSQLLLLVVTLPVLFYHRTSSTLRRI